MVNLPILCISDHYSVSMANTMYLWQILCIGDGRSPILCIGYRTHSENGN